MNHDLRFVDPDNADDFVYKLIGQLKTGQFIYQELIPINEHELLIPIDLSATYYDGNDYFYYPNYSGYREIISPVTASKRVPKDLFLEVE